MRTAIFIVAGLVLLAIIVVLSKPDFRAHAALIFIGIWLLVSIGNLLLGLSHGYSLKEELLVHAALFGVPAAAALALWFRLQQA